MFDSGPRHLPSKSHVPDALYIWPSGVRVIFWTCFAISARAIRGLCSLF